MAVQIAVGRFPHPLRGASRVLSIPGVLPPANFPHPSGVSEAAARLAENEYELRDKDLPVIIDLVARSRNILANINSKNPRALGEWGYTVDDTPRPPKASKPAKDADPAP